MNNKQITNNKTRDNRNPVALMVSNALSGDEATTVYIRTTDRMTEQQYKYNLVDV
jgi:hypothetical protein